jgi:hypothetical protein
MQNSPCGGLGMRMAMQPQLSEAGEREAAAAYVADLTSDLASLARQHGLDTLGYLLDMARLEAESNTRRLSSRS